MRPQELAERALELLGPDRGSVVVEHRTSANLRWANSTLTTNGMTTQQTVHVVAQPSVPGGVGSGTASAVIRSVDDLHALVAQARSEALGAGPAQDVAPEVGVRPASPTWDLAPVLSAPDELAPVSALLSEVLPAADVEHFGYAEHSITSTYLGTTSGLRLRHDQPAARFELCGKAGGGSRSAWAGRTGRSFAQMDLAGTPAEVRRGLVAQLSQVEVAPGRHRVLLSPSAAADMLIYLLWSAGARDAVEGRSAFSRHGGGTRVGDRLGTLPVWLRSDPAAPGLECADHVQDVVSSALSSTFDTGLSRTATDWVAEGTLRALVTTRHSAGLADIAHTPFVDNLMAGVDGCAGTLDELAARLGDGLLVTCLWYIREVDAQSLLLTGLTRDGVYVVRDGQVIGAAGNFRFNESPLGMLDRIVDAGAPVDCLPREWADWFTRTRVAPMAIEDFNLSTASQAV
jgi:predicted Zn-dependent protease